MDFSRELYLIQGSPTGASREIFYGTKDDKNRSAYGAFLQLVGKEPKGEVVETYETLPGSYEGDLVLDDGSGPQRFRVHLGTKGPWTYGDVPLFKVVEGADASWFTLQSQSWFGSVRALDGTNLQILEGNNMPYLFQLLVFEPDGPAYQWNPLFIADEATQ